MLHHFKKIIVLCVIALPISVWGANAYLNNVRVIDMGASTRIIFSLTQPVQQHVLKLSKPDRLVVEMNHVQMMSAIGPLHLPTKQVKSLRSLSEPSGKLQIVITIDPNAEFKVIASPESKRFAVDVMTGKANRPQIHLVVPHVLTHLQPIAVAPLHRDITVVIDPGHGGKDPGAMGIHGMREKDVVLMIAKRLANLINQQPNMHAVLTRKGDYFVPLIDRLKLARKGKADLFIAIHADSYFNTEASGASVYALSRRGATSVAAKWLANRENHSELGGVELGALEDQSVLLRSVLIDLAQTATITDSLRLGSTTLNALNRVTDLHYKRVEQAPFMVLKSPDIPSILVETGFISNANEEVRLNSEKYQNELAHALYNGVQAYLKKYSSTG